MFWPGSDAAIEGHHRYYQSPIDSLTSTFVELGEKSAAELRKLEKSLLALFDHDVEPGQTLLLRTDDAGHIDLELAGHRKAGPQSPKLVRALWRVWLGQKPVSKELSRALVEKLDLLGR